jgi:GTP-binding protein EngB required for normal cell division
MGRSIPFYAPRRIALIRGGGSGAHHSQTGKVCVYHIHHENGFGIPFSLTIVDTPGFGDTTGRQRDEEITADITHLFKDENGIQVVY